MPFLAGSGWRRESRSRAQSGFSGTSLSLSVLLLLLGPFGLGGQGLDTLSRLVVGVEMGDPEQEFGSLEGVVRDARGRIFALDRRSTTVRVFGPDGAFLYRIGRSGQGPGEFVNPWAMAMDPEGRLVVVDPAGGRVTVFRPGETRADVILQVPSTTQVMGVCATREAIYLLTPRMPSLIRVLRWDGTDGPAFGDPVEPTEEQRRIMRSDFYRLSEGSLTCSEEEGMVVFASVAQGEVRAYTSGGQLRWRSRLPDYHPVEFRWVESLGACCLYAPSRVTNTIQAAVSLAVLGDRLHIGVIEQAYEDPPVRGYQTRVLSLADGRQLSVGEVDYAVSGFHRGRPFGFSRLLPYPRVIVER